MRDHHPVNYSSQNLEVILDTSFFYASPSQFLVSFIFWPSPSIFYFSLSLPVATASVLQWAPKCSCWIHSCHIKSVFHVASRIFFVFLFDKFVFKHTSDFPTCLKFSLLLVLKQNSLKWCARPFVDWPLPHLYCILVLSSFHSIFQKHQHFKGS